jgi:Raf kinase inhibitor-like YbhB/YbcL family protein
MPGDAPLRPRSAPGATRRGGSPLRSAALVVLALVAAPAAAGCGDDDDGRALRRPRADQTTTTTAASTTLGSDAAAGGDPAASSSTEPVRLSSTAFGDGAEIPTDYTCRGDDLSPPLLWTGMPPATTEIAVVVRDVDAEGFVHWVIAGLPATVGGLAENTPPAEAVEATNDLGRPGWAGPCPPSGTHNYEIRVYALSQPSGITDGQPGPDAAAQVEATPALASAVLSGWARAG